MTAPMKGFLPYELAVSPINCARLFLLYRYDTAQIATTLGVPEAVASRLLTKGLDDPASDRFRAVKKWRAA